MERIATLELANGIRVGLCRNDERRRGETVGGERYDVIVCSRLETECGQPVSVSSPVHATIMGDFGPVEARLVGDEITFGMGRGDAPVGLEAMT